MSIRTFNFHNLAGIEITSEDLGLISFFEAEYRSYSAPISKDMNIVTLNWKNSSWPFVDGFRFKTHKLLARWSYKITFPKTGIRIDSRGNQMAVPMIHHMLVHPSLRQICARRRLLMLHASAVVFQGKSLIFTGTGGAGKTTISSLLMKYGGNQWQLHADDYVFLAKGPVSYSYMTRSHLYRDQIKWIPDIQKKLSTREILHLEFFGRLREISNDQIKWPLRIEPYRLWPDHNVAEKADLAAIIILSRKNTDRMTLERVEGTKKIARELVNMNFHEARHFIELTRNTCDDSLFNNMMSNWKENENNLLFQILEEAPLYRLNLPSNANCGDRCRFGELLLETLKPIIDTK